MKTIKQIADSLGVSKQQVYRHIKKNHISEVVQENGTMYYDDVVLEQIKQAFSDKEPLQRSDSDAHQNRINEAVIDALTKELLNKDEQLKAKDLQIEKLMLLLDQQQQLTGDLQTKLDKQQLMLEDKRAGGFLSRFRKKGD